MFRLVGAVVRGVFLVSSDESSRRPPALEAADAYC
jgi:hypothetical protein